MSNARYSWHIAAGRVAPNTADEAGVKAHSSKAGNTDKTRLLLPGFSLIFGDSVIPQL